MYLFSSINSVLWGFLLPAFLAFSGVLLSFRAGFPQLSPPREWVRALGSSFEAVCTSLAGTVGTGNIVGVAVAITLGGPGALFWMWVSALVGMGTKYAEVYLAAKHRGGPMVYITRELGEGFAPLAASFAAAGALAAFGIGNMVQVGSIAAAISDAASALAFSAPHPAILGLGLAALFLASAKGRGRALSFIVPVMAVLYLAGAGWVVICNIGAVPGAVASVFRGALRPEAVLWGFRRGMLSNEAGLGSSPIAHAETKNPPRPEGLLGVFEVSFDTLLVSSATGLMLLVSGTAEAGPAWPRAALEAAFGPEAASVFLTLSLSLFAWSSVLSWSGYGEKCAGYLIGGATAAYRIVFALVMVPAAFLPYRSVLEVSDALTAAMAITNVSALLLITRSGPYLRSEA